MKYNLFFLLTFAIANSMFSQTIDWSKFITKDYVILDTVYGDLNRDGLTDAILILKYKEEKVDSGTVRPLLILEGQKDGSLKLVERNDSIVLCFGCGGVFGDPYSKTVITKNYFSIEHYGGSSDRWARIITFKYDMKTKQYLLHKDTEEHTKTTDPDYNEIINNNEDQWNKTKFKDYIVE